MTDFQHAGPVPPSGSRRGLLRAVAALGAGAASAGLVACSSSQPSGGGGAATTQPAGGGPSAGSAAPWSAPASSATTEVSASAVPAAASPVQPAAGTARLLRPQDGAAAADRDESAALAGTRQGEQKAPQPVEYPAAATATSPTATASSSPAATRASASPTTTAPTATASPTATSATAKAAVAAGTLTAAAGASATAAASTTGATGTSTGGAEPRARDDAASRAAARGVQEATVFGAAGRLSPAQAKEHLLRRATFGPRPSDRADLDRLGIDAWLEGQLTQVPDPMGDAIAAQFNQAGTSIPAVIGSIRPYAWSAQMETAQMLLGRWIFSTRQLFEIVVDVFSNLLNCAMPTDGLWATGADYHHEVVRKHAYGKYRDMLLAAMRHPAMLGYLNNDQSNRTHVNEDLGRELLELHTVGVTGGYTEDDVVSSAKILSGRSIDYTPMTFTYKPSHHFVGPVKVMDFSDPNSDPDKGLELGDRYVSYLSTLPATARTVARKIAVRFVSDNPPQALVDRLAAAYLDADTAIVPVLRALFASDEFWSSVGQKTRRPAEDMVACARALDIQLPDPAAAKKGIAALYYRAVEAGHAPLRWGPPDGYPDVAAAWESAGQMLHRWTTHRGLTGGWYEGLKPLAATETFQPKPSETMGPWVDRICTYLLGATWPAERRAVLVEFLGGSESTPVQGHEWKASHVAALVLDSLYLQVR